MKNFFLVLLSCAILWPAFAANFPEKLSGIDIATGLSREISLKDKVSAIIFLSSRCPCSQSHEASLNALVQEFPEVHFVGIHSNTNENPAEAKKHFASSELAFPVLQDDGAKWAGIWGALKTPHVFIMSPSGTLLFSGGVSDSHDAARAKKQYLREALLSVRQGKQPDPKEVRTLGCVIQR